MSEDRRQDIIEKEQLEARLAAVEAERDYYRMAAEKLGQKSLADAQDYSRIIRRSKETEEKLRLCEEGLAKTVAEQTAELLRANKGLRESEATYRGIIDSFSEAVYIIDEQGKFVDVNKGAERMYGYTREELIGMSPADVSAPGKNDLPAVMEKCLRAFSGEPQELEFWGLAKDGRIFPKEVHGCPGEYFGKKVIVAIAQDITERKQAEEALRESEGLYRLLTEVSPNSISVADTAGIVRMLNRKALELFGHGHESEVIGRSMFEWVSAESQAIAAAAFQELFRKGSVIGLELKFLRKDGAEFMGDVNASILNDAEGRPKLVILVTSDITQRKRAETERLKLQKLEAIGTLAGGIAHDFNNLLQGVFGYISMARMKIGEKEKAAAMLEQAEKALNMSVNLTTQLLTFSKGGKPVKKRIELKPAIENAAKFALSGSRCDCRMVIAEDLWPADADEGQIGQVLQNIVMNASEAMPAGGSIGISAENIEIPKGENPLLPEGGSFARISVRDTGIGIPEQYLPKIFDPYFTTKQKGSGLGLATSFSIVRNHGGIIEAVSEHGEGSAFTIYLPALDAGEPVGQAASDAVSGGTRRILLMDDEELVRDIAGEMLEALGHRVEYAKDGKEAVEKYAEAMQTGNPFDIVILDLTIKGGMGGEETIRKIREIAPEVKAVVSSGYADNPVVSDCRAYGFVASLNKPYRIEALRDCLNMLLS
ncbi:MAG: PAS domain S-box protein [Thermodesulfovibrionales bacterium]